MDYKELSKRIHEITVKRGDENCSNDHYLMRVIVEVSNAVQAYDNNFRVGKDFISHYKDGMVYKSFFFNNIWRSVEDCFANIVIRLLYFADKRGIPFDYKADCENKFEHLTFTEAAYEFIFNHITIFWYIYPNVALADALHYVENWAEHMGIDLEFFVKAKIAYNELLDGVSIDEEIVNAVDEHFHEML